MDSEDKNKVSKEVQTEVMKQVIDKKVQTETKKEVSL